MAKPAAKQNDAGTPFDRFVKLAQKRTVHYRPHQIVRTVIHRQYRHASLHFRQHNIVAHHRSI